MQYFKNVELTRLYPVSEAAVRKWIEGARNGKLELQLYEHSGKPHIANTAKNQRVIEELVARGKKYKNSRGHKVVTPKPEFYELYSQKQKLDIITNLEIHHELLQQYNYFNGGVEYWDQYAWRLWQEEGENTLSETIALLRSNFGNINELINGYQNVNVIDLGAGNCLPVKELLTHLLYDRAVLSRYIAIDISKEMLQIAEKNIQEWFDGRVNFEGYERDFSDERFDDLLVGETFGNTEKKTINLVLILGGTINNFRVPDEVLRVVHRSMGRNDILITSRKLDSNESRRYFDFNTGEQLPKVPDVVRTLINLLNIDDSLYEVEQEYNEAKKVRSISIRLKLDLTFKFKFDLGERSVELHKGDSILLWRAWHQSPVDVVKQFDRSGFALLQASATKERHFLLTASEIAHPN
jgi:uncharacterized SAM-dependent methyltransferase